MTEGLQEKYNLEVEPITGSSESQLHFMVTKPGAGPTEIPTFLFDSHTQAHDVTAANAMADQVMPIVAQNGVIAVQ